MLRKISTALIKLSDDNKASLEQSIKKNKRRCLVLRKIKTTLRSGLRLTRLDLEHRNETKNIEPRTGVIQGTIQTDYTQHTLSYHYTTILFCEYIMCHSNFA